MLDPVTRRRFFIAAIAFSGLSTELGPSVLGIAKAFAQTGAQLEPGTRAAMVRMARLIYPHDAIPDDVYGQVLDQALTALAGDPAFSETLRAAERSLNALQQRPWIDLDEQAQIAAIRTIERTDMFAAIQAAVQTKLYNHPAVWARLGYEGPSYDKGGYIGRGAGRVDWLPEGR